MDYNQLLQHKPEMIALFGEYGVTNPRVFGSTAHGTASENSDVDFLISWSTRHSLLDRIALKHKLESLLKVKVDLVTDHTLDPLIRDEVLKKAERL